MYQCFAHGFVVVVVQGLDEIQSYILLRRWYFLKVSLNNDPKRNEDPTSLENCKPLEGGKVDFKELTEIARIYFEERLYLLRSLEELLWVGEGIAGEGPFADVIEQNLGKLLSKDHNIEETTTQCLIENLKEISDTKKSSGIFAPVSLENAAAMRNAIQQLKEDASIQERNTMLTILQIIYFHPRKRCSPDRYLELAKCFHSYLFTYPMSYYASDKTVNAMKTSLELALLLLLEVLALDVENIMESLAEGRPITQEIYPFMDESFCSKVHNEFSSWAANLRPIHKPILLTWAAIIHLCDCKNYVCDNLIANTVGALEELATLTQWHDLQHSAIEMSANIMLCPISAMLAAFELDPLSLSQKDVEALTSIISNVFRHQAALCEQFWLENVLLFEPIHHFIKNLTGFFPARPALLLKILGSLASSPRSAEAANSYFARINSMTCLHHDTITDLVLEDDTAIAQEALKLPEAPMLTIPSGSVGNVIDGIPTLSDSNATIVRWEMQWPEGTAHWVLLCGAFETLKEAQNHILLYGNSGEYHHVVKKALEHISKTLEFFFSLSCHNIKTAFELLHVEAPIEENGLLERGPDIISLATSTLSSIPDLIKIAPEATLEASAKALCVMKIYAPHAPGRVVTEVRRALGLDTLLCLSEAYVGKALSGKTNGRKFVMSLQLLVETEQKIGKYYATQSFVELMRLLLRNSNNFDSILPCVEYILSYVVPRMMHWRFLREDDRWNLAKSFIDIVRSTVLSLEELDGNSFTKYDKDITALIQNIMWLLPPDCKTLEGMAQYRSSLDEVEGAEKCVIAWLRLIPILLHPKVSNTMSMDLSLHLFQGGSSSVASILLSFLTYMYFGTRERALVVEALNCFAKEALLSAPEFPIATLLAPQLMDSSDHVAQYSSNAACVVLRQCLSLGIARSCPYLFGSVCNVLITAVKGHPSLLDALFFPSCLEKLDSDSEGKGKIIKSDENNTDITPAQEPTCLDALWDLLSQSEVLTKDNPYAIAKVMRVVAAIWQAGGPSSRALQTLRCQPGIWKAILHVVTTSSRNKSLIWDFIVEYKASKIQMHKKNLNLQEILDESWRISCEAAALDILSAEFFIWTKTSSLSPLQNFQNTNSEKNHNALPNDLELFLMREMLPGELVSFLLSRYSDMISTNLVLVQLQKAAAAFGARVLGAAIFDPIVWSTLEAFPSVFHDLAAILQPELLRQGCSSLEDAMKVLLNSSKLLLTSETANQKELISGISFSFWSRIANTVQNLSVPSQIIVSDREYGLDYTFDKQTFSMKLCIDPLIRYLDMDDTTHDMLDVLNKYFELASAMCSLEDARLNAFYALDVCVAISQGAIFISKEFGTNLKSSYLPEKSGLKIFDAILMAWKSVNSSMDHLVEESTKCHEQRSNTACLENMYSNSNKSLNVIGVHLASTAAASKIALALLRLGFSHSSSDWIDDINRLRKLAAVLLQLCITYLENYKVILQSSSLFEETGDVPSITIIDPKIGKAFSTEASMHLKTISRCVLTATLQVISCLSLTSRMNRSSTRTESESNDESDEELNIKAIHLLPLLVEMFGLSPASSGSVPAISLAISLGEQLIPPVLWLSMVRDSASLGKIVSESFDALVAKIHVAPIEEQKPELGSAIDQQEMSDFILNGDKWTNGNNENSPLFSSTPQEALLHLLLHAAQIQGGQSFLVEEGIPAVLAAMASWLMAPLPYGGDLMGESPGLDVDYANAYLTNCTENPMQRLWCSLLALAGILLSGSHENSSLHGFILQLVTIGDSRLRLAIDPPMGTVQQPITLAMSQETRYSLFLLSNVAEKLGGQWMISLPRAPSLIRQSTASLLAFFSAPSDEVVYIALDRQEKKMLQTRRNYVGLSEDWFAVPVLSSFHVNSAGAGCPAGSSINKKFCFDSDNATPTNNAFVWKLVENIYASVSYALALQNKTATQISEAEISDLGPEWVDVDTLTALNSQSIDALKSLCETFPKLDLELDKTYSCKMMRTFVSITKSSLDMLAVLAPSKFIERQNFARRSLTDAENLLKRCV